MPYDLCLFDLDGTLTDPKIGITRSYQRALAAFGIDEDIENLTRFIGPPLRDVFHQVYGFSNEDVEKAVTVFRAYFAEVGIYENTLYPGIPEALQRLADAGITLAVATSKVTDFAHEVLSHFALDQYFAFVSGDDMEGSMTKHGKLDIIRAAMGHFPPEAKKAPVMIGDRVHDMAGAKDAGIDGIGVLWGYGSLAELEEAGATLLANTPDTLRRLLLDDAAAGGI